MNHHHSVRHLVVAVAAVTLLALPGLVLAGDLVVVVNAKNTTGAMTAEQVGAVFLGKTATLPSGGTAAMADQSEGSPAYDEFYSKVAGKTGAQVKATWARLTFSGKGTPPKALANSAEVKKFVAGNPDAIGYIDKSAVDGTVKVVLSVD